MRALLVLAAVLAMGTTARAADRLRVGTPEPTAFVFSALSVGIETGIFKKQGLDVERLDFAGGAKMHQAMAAVEADAEGLRHRNLPLFSVQYHPEASPGPHDSAYLFDQFVKLMAEFKAGGGA